MERNPRIKELQIKKNPAHWDVMEIIDSTRNFRNREIQQVIRDAESDRVINTITINPYKMCRDGMLDHVLSFADNFTNHSYEVTSQLIVRQVFPPKRSSTK